LSRFVDDSRVIERARARCFGRGLVAFSDIGDCFDGRIYVRPDDARCVRTDMITTLLIPIVIGFGVLGLIAFFRKPVDMRAAAGAWKTPIPTDTKPTDPSKRT